MFLASQYGVVVFSTRWRFWDDGPRLTQGLAGLDKRTASAAQTSHKVCSILYMCFITLTLAPERIPFQVYGPEANSTEQMLHSCSMLREVPASYVLLDNSEQVRLLELMCSFGTRIVHIRY